MNRIGTLSTLLIVVLLTACGGGGESDGGVVNTGGNSTNVTASFTADSATPGANTVSLQEGSKSSNSVSVIVQVTETSGVFGAGFDVVYDSSRAAYQGYSKGVFLEQGGRTVLYQVSEPVPGRLVIGVALQGNAGTAGTTTSSELMRLTFRVNQVSNTRVTLENAGLFDDQITPQTIPNLTWSEGSLNGV